MKRIVWVSKLYKHTIYCNYCQVFSDEIGSEITLDFVGDSRYSYDHKAAIFNTSEQA